MSKKHVRSFTLPAIVFIMAVTGCEKPPDVPSQSTRFRLVYSSQTSDAIRLADESTAHDKLEDIMEYVGVIPAVEDVSSADPPYPPTVLNSLCTSFMDKDDPDQQQMCGTDYMLRDYTAKWRTEKFGPPPPPSPPVKLAFTVAPLHQINGDYPAVGIVSKDETLFDPFSEALFLFSDAIDARIGSGDDAPARELRRNTYAMVTAHELGHLLAAGIHLTHIEQYPEYHDGEYSHGCLMRRQFDPRNYDYDEHFLIFCRRHNSDATDTEKANTCHGRLRYRFGLPYGDVSQ